MARRTIRVIRGVPPRQANDSEVGLRPSIPLEYVSKGWDFGWVMTRTDGHVALSNWRRAIRTARHTALFAQSKDVLDATRQIKAM